jgi:hypothetical protein
MHIVHKKTTFYIRVFNVKSAMHGNLALSAEGKQHCRTAGVDKAITDLCVCSRVSNIYAFPLLKPGLDILHDRFGLCFLQLCMVSA